MKINGIKAGLVGTAGGLNFPRLYMTRHWAYALPLADYFPRSSKVAERKMKLVNVPLA